MNLANSSIWDSKTGFGGDGDPNGLETVGGGRCVVDGPFSRLKPIVYNHTFTRHCLSRGFRDGDTMGHIPGARYSPESVGNILRKETYKDFVKDLELDLHNTLHISINGDFKAMTAANGKKRNRLIRAVLKLIPGIQTLFSTFIMHSWIIYGGDGNKRTQQLDWKSIKENICTTLQMRQL